MLISHVSISNKYPLLLIWIVINTFKKLHLLVVTSAGILINVIINLSVNSTLENNFFSKPIRTKF